MGGGGYSLRTLPAIITLPVVVVVMVVLAVVVQVVVHQGRDEC